jgi:hypothetical protein
LQAAGKWRQEGKSYEMQDGMNKTKLIFVEQMPNTLTGDMVHYQFNVTKDPKKK